ncbi:MAG TPA: hypothetical protein VEX42_02490 [Microbacterium sp.]|nr:hypothetical protein [Microbacterium sp.]
MSPALDLLHAEIEAVPAIWRDADAVALSDGELIAVNERYCRMRRMLDADQALLAAEIAPVPAGARLGGLAKTQGYRNPTALIAATGGTSNGDAARLVKVGEATAPRQLLSGEKAPARHPHVAEALANAALTAQAAGAIIAMLDRVALRAGHDAIDAAEKTLAAQAPGCRWITCPGSWCARKHGPIPTASRPAKMSCGPSR